MIEIRNQWFDDHNSSNPKKARFKIEDYDLSTAKKQFYFSPNSFPLSIVANYQLCDIHLPKVQEMLKNVSLSDTCSKHSGWFKKEFIDEIRSVMYEYLERAWQKYLIGDLQPCDDEHFKLYSEYAEEDNLDYTRQKITKELENDIDESSLNEDENDESFFINNIKDKYDHWATLDREELAKIIFSDTRIKTEPEVLNSNPCSDDEDYVGFKMDNLDI